MSRLDDDALRALVRGAVARRLGTSAAAGSDSGPLTWTVHASHARYVLPESEGPCLIEPSVPCTHCGYCQSHGH